MNKTINIENTVFTDIFYGKGTEISLSDILEVTELDLSIYALHDKDMEILKEFKNIKYLGIESREPDLSYLKFFPLLESLQIEYPYAPFNIESVCHLTELSDLWISGGLISNMDIINTEALARLTKLEYLGFHEFGTVDLSFLKKLPGLRSFFCGYANKVYNIESIKHLTALEELNLADIDINNLDFLGYIPEKAFVELCGIRLWENPSLEILKRFSKTDISEIYNKDNNTLVNTLGEYI